MVMNGPAKSTAVLTNAFSDDFNQIRGKGAIICFALFAFLLLHIVHSFSQSVISSLAATIQNLVEVADKVWLVPAIWLPISW